MTPAHYDTVVLMTQATYQQRRSEEALEAIMSLALFDRSHCVVFWDQGLSWLVPRQSPILSKSLSKQLSALPLYGSEALFYCEPHRVPVLGDQAIAEEAEAISLEAVAQLLRNARHVEVF